MTKRPPIVKTRPDSQGQIHYRNKNNGRFESKRRYESYREFLRPKEVRVAKPKTYELKKKEFEFRITRKEWKYVQPTIKKFRRRGLDKAEVKEIVRLKLRGYDRIKLYKDEKGKVIKFVDRVTRRKLTPRQIRRFKYLTMYENQLQGIMAKKKMTHAQAVKWRKHLEETKGIKFIKYYYGT